jgi:hypothetical protein
MEIGARRVDRREQWEASSIPIIFPESHTLSGWWFGTWLLFFHILRRIMPTDFHIFRGDETTNQS